MERFAPPDTENSKNKIDNSKKCEKKIQCGGSADPDTDPACHFVADPDLGSACHFDADPDPDPTPFTLMRIQIRILPFTLMWIRILASK